MTTTDPTLDEFRQAIAGRRQWAIDTLADLVRFPSVLGQEQGAQRHLAGVFKSLGYDVHIEPHRPRPHPRPPGV